MKEINFAVDNNYAVDKNNVDVGDGDIEGSVMDEVDDAVVLECRTSTASMLKSAVRVLTILE